MVSILEFGGIGDGVTPNDYAFTAWLATLPPSGGALKFPAGVYAFASPCAITLATQRACITLEGDGSNLSELLWPAAGGGLTITAGGAPGGTLNSAHISGLSFRTAVSSGAGTALTFTSSYWNLGTWTTLDDLLICGNDGPDGGEYWDTAILFNGWGCVNARAVNTNGSAGKGIGVIVHGDLATSLYGILYNFQQCSFNCHSKGFIYGGYIQGVTFNQCNFNGEYFATAITSNAGEPGILSLLSVVGSQFDYGGSAIALFTGVDSVQLVNNTFTLSENGESAVYLASAFQFNSTGNYYNVNTNTNPHPTGMFGLVVGPPGFGTSNGDCFKDLACPINLKAGTSNIAIGANRYYQTCGANIDSGTGNIWLTMP